MHPEGSHLTMDRLTLRVPTLPWPPSTSPPTWFPERPQDSKIYLKASENAPSAGGSLMPLPMIGLPAVVDEELAGLIETCILEGAQVE